MTFDTRSFFKTILIFVLLSAAWIFIAILLRLEFRLALMLSYPLVFASSVYFSRQLKPFTTWLWMAFIMLVAGRGLASLLIFLYPVNEYMYYVVNNILLALVFAVLLNTLYGMRRYWLIGVLAAAAATVEQLIVMQLPDIQAPYILIGVYQLALLVPLAAGLSLHEKEPGSA